MSHSDTEEKYVCPQCIGENYLSTQIKTNRDAKRKCSYCDNDDQPCFLIGELADHVHEVIETQSVSFTISRWSHRKSSLILLKFL